MCELCHSTGWIMTTKPKNSHVTWQTSQISQNVSCTSIAALWLLQIINYTEQIHFFSFVLRTCPWPLSRLCINAATPCVCWSHSLLCEAFRDNADCRSVFCHMQLLQVRSTFFLLTTTAPCVALSSVHSMMVYFCPCCTWLLRKSKIIFNTWEPNLSSSPFTLSSKKQFEHIFMSFWIYLK